MNMQSNYDQELNYHNFKKQAYKIKKVVLSETLLPIKSTWHCKSSCF